MELTKKQLIAYATLVNDKARFLLYGGAGGGGKSWLGCSWLLDMCRRYPGVRYFIGRNNLKDTRESVAITFQKVAKSINFEQYRLSDDYILFDNASMIVFIDLTFYPKKDPMFERFGSKEYTGGWIEEAGEVHPLAFEVLKSRIGRHMNDIYKIPPQILLTCNPKKNFLYNMFYKPYQKGELKYPYSFIPALKEDNKYLTKEYIESLNNITDKVTKERISLGIWEYDDNPALLLDFDAISDIFTNEFIKPNGKKRISADIALKGRDSYVRADIDGMVYKFDVRPIMSPTEVVNDIKSKCESDRIPKSSVVVDSDGVGAYVGDFVGQGVYEFHGNKPSISGKYINIKSECAYKLAEFINERKIRIICEDVTLRERITRELEILQADNIYNDTKKKGIISKDIMRALLGASPDILDTLIMSMIWYVKPQAKGVRIASIL